jgi:rare lipoprotein A (peptidoglycan hydrolase)
MDDMKMQSRKPGGKRVDSAPMNRFDSSHPTAVLALIVGILSAQGCALTSGTVLPTDRAIGAPEVQSVTVRPQSKVTVTEVPRVAPVAKPVHVGKASWYGPGFSGRKTASGEIFDDARFTAAHKTLPLGSAARVTNLSNGKSVKVEINDRGPYAENRIIDLSRAAARAIGMIDDGVVQVQIDPLTTDQADTDNAD